MPFSLSRLLTPAVQIEISNRPETMESAPVPPDWVIEGQPEARVGKISNSEDTFTSTFIWSCTAGRFNWYFASDETVHIIEGEVIVTDDHGEQRRLGPGAVALFRAGSHSVWHVPHFVKKIAFIYEAPPVAVSLSLRALRKILTLMRGTPKSRLAA
jgi:uncharacterized cupin superfamily protein